MMDAIENLIICSPYNKPIKHWKYNRTTKKFKLIFERRPASFIKASPHTNSHDDPGVIHELKEVNKIRVRVDTWREKGYPNVTGITKQLLEFWNDKSREHRLFFCQLEAIETLIWWTESPSSERVGLNIPRDHELFQRLCSKMATGTGKTVVMAMLIAWQVINKATYPQDTRFSKNILVVTPGLTVKSRLQVLYPSSRGDFYTMFNIIPDTFYPKISKLNLTIHNWQAMKPNEDAPNSIVKLGPENDGVFAKRILGYGSNNIIVINDEAHHAYRAVKSDVQSTKHKRDTRWMESLDKIHRTTTILCCFDFSATPFVSSNKITEEDGLFPWIVSDFSLNDAIESGLTKTPRVAIRDDTNKFDKEYRSRFYHLYKDDEVKPDLNRTANEQEKLPSLVKNAYILLGQDWIATKMLWDKMHSKIPPVMISVCNRTHTAARVKYSFEHERFDLNELSNKNHILHIDSTMLARAEAGEGGIKENELRNKVDTVGKICEPGEQIRNIVAVSMLSEGWDANNVTHIMGLRAFTSQILCEQVIGRGLRRRSYEIDPKTGLFSPEYVNVFGVPFTFLPHEQAGEILEPPLPTTLIAADPEKVEHEISWPNIDRIDIDFVPKLVVNWDELSPLELKSNGIAISAGMAQVLEGKPDVSKMLEINLKKLDKKIRLQHIVFLAAKDVYDTMSPSWKGIREMLLIQIVKLVEEFIHRMLINVVDVRDDELRTRMTILFNMEKVASHICHAIKDFNTERRKLVLNRSTPIKSTKTMRSWYTKKPTEYATKSHINHAVYDSTWEASAGQELERNKNVVSWARNARLGFVIKYIYNGTTSDYWPDFLIRLKNNITLVLEIKGKDDERNKTKRQYLKEWVEVVNESGNYGVWAWDVAFDPSDVKGIINKYSKAKIPIEIYAKCPKCRTIAKSQQKVDEKFGFRNIDGIVKPQSWCKKCRTDHR